MEKDLFKEYIKESEPDKASKGYVWSTAIGLQAVDGLKPSKYLIDTAIQNIEGNITLKEAQKLIDSYYEQKQEAPDGERTEEADKVSARIAEILSETAFSFSPNEYISIHRRLFRGIYEHAGKIRDYNITKKEWILDGATERQSNFVRPFIDNINMINDFYNKPLQMLVDKDNLYIASVGVPRAYCPLYTDATIA